MVKQSQLLVFQRNPPWMLPTPNYHEQIEPGMAWLLRSSLLGRWFRFWQFWIAGGARWSVDRIGITPSRSVVRTKTSS